MKESTSSEIQQANASTKNENQNTEIQNEQLENFIIEKFGNLEPPPTECRINRVPYHLRNQNNEAYTPHVISIGPIHHDKKKFLTTEKYKVRYFRNFMQQVIKHNGIKLEDLVSTIKKMEDRIRRCYVETITLESDDFVNMIILDVSFILELFLRNNGKIDNPMGMEGWLMPMVLRELLLLENQLPFFVIEKLYHLTVLPSLSNPISLIQLTFDFFKYFNIYNKSPDNVEIKHFTDLLRYFQLPPPNELPERDHEAKFPKYFVTQLYEAGVKFKVASSKYVASRRRDEKASTKCVLDEVASSKCILDDVALSIRDEKPSSKCVVLDEEASTKCLPDEVASSVRDEDPSSRILDLSFKNGVLEIPFLLFDDDTEALVRNIMALEQCDYKTERYVSDFYLILDDLINTTEDVELLIKKGILVNKIGDNNAVTSMINNLNRGINWHNMNSEFCQLSEDLNKHYERTCNRWRAMLRQQYFSTPWRSASTVAAIILLVLTLIQTVFSILK
jgi:hypothetical protein